MTQPVRDDMCMLRIGTASGSSSDTTPLLQGTHDNENDGSSHLSGSSSDRNNKDENRTGTVDGAGSTMECICCKIPIPLRYLCLIALVVSYDALLITLKYLQVDVITQEKLTYAPTTVVVLAEITKFVLSLLFTILEHRDIRKLLKALKQHFLIEWDILIATCAVAGLYVGSNNLLHDAAHNLNVTTFIITYQFKIIIAAVTRVVLLRQNLQYPLTQWISLVVLLLGIIMVQIAEKDPITAELIPDDDHFLVGGKLKGIEAGLAACFFSGAAGALWELLLKERKASIWIRNVQLAAWSILLSLAASYMFDDKLIEENGFFHGYGILTWFVVFLYAFVGLSVAAVLRFCDVIVKGFATCIAIILACLISHFLFNYKFTALFISGAVLVALSVTLYYYHSKKEHFQRVWHFLRCRPPPEQLETYGI